MHFRASGERSALEANRVMRRMSGLWGLMHANRWVIAFAFWVSPKVQCGEVHR